MFDRSDGGFHSSSQILPTRTRISSPLAAQGYLYVLLRETQHTLGCALERQGLTRVAERTAFAASGIESCTIAMLFSPGRHFCLLSVGASDCLGFAVGVELPAKVFQTQVQSAIRGRKPSEEKLGLEDFGWELDADGKPQTVTCPNGQQAEVTAGRKEHRYRAAFDAADCESCSFCDSCPTLPLKCTPERVLRFSQQDIEVALRRQRTADAHASGQNLRAAVEATVRSIKHPFGNGKVPVRGQPRVSIVMLGSAAMSNLRRIHRYLVGQEEAKRAKKSDDNEARRGQQVPGGSLFPSLLVPSRNSLRLISRLMRPLQPIPAHGA